MSKSMTVEEHHNQVQFLKMAEEASSFSELARIIYADWGKDMYFGAKPYVSAMMSLTSEFDLNEPYGADNAKYIAVYFLANARSWKGPVARTVKAIIKHKTGVK